MDDVIKRVREYGELLANGAPHQQGIGRDILHVVSTAASHMALATASRDYADDAPIDDSPNARMTEAIDMHKTMTSEHGTVARTPPSPMSEFGHSGSMIKPDDHKSADDKFAGGGTMASSTAAPQRNDVEKHEPAKNAAKLTSGVDGDGGHLTTAEHNKRVAAVAKDLDTKGKHEPVDVKKK